MNFALEKMESWTHCNIIFLDEYLKLKEIEYLINCAKFKMWPVGNSAHITDFLVLGKVLLARLHLLYLTENLKPYME